MKRLTLTILLTVCLTFPALAQTKQPRNLIDEVCKDGKQHVNPLNADGDDGRDVRQISRYQFQRLAERVRRDAPALLKARDKSGKTMNAETVLLKELYSRVLLHLGHTSVSPITDTKGFKTFEFAYRQALYEVVASHAKVAFDYSLIVNRMMEAAKVRKVRQ